MENTKQNLNKEEYSAIANRLKELRKAKGYSNYEHIAYALEMRPKNKINNKLKKKIIFDLLTKYSLRKSSL